MKTFLAFLLSCLTLSAATTYPVLTDSTNRLFPGGVTNVFFLNSNVVTTGTMRATGAVTLTNSGNVFAGDGSGLTGIGGGTNAPLLNGTNTFTGTNTFSAGVHLTSVLAILNASSIMHIKRDEAGTALKITRSDARGHLQLGNNSGGGDPYSLIDSTGPLQIRINGSASFLELGRVTDVLGFAGTSSSEPGLKRSGATLKVRLADDSADAAFTTGALTIGGGTAISKVISATATLNFDLTAITVEDLTITVTGAADGDVVSLGVPNGSITTSVQYSAWVSAADTVTVRARTSATGENPASGTFRATVIKH